MNGWVWNETQLCIQSTWLAWFVWLASSAVKRGLFLKSSLKKKLKKSEGKEKKKRSSVSEPNCETGEYQ